MAQNDDLRPLVLAVDDTPENLALIAELLRDDYRIRVATQGVDALRLAATAPIPDLILLDVMMPGMNGFEVCERLHDNAATAGIPVIFLTALASVEDERHGLQVGAVDYVTKPISPPILQARVRTHLRLKASTDFLRDKADFLEREVLRRTREITTIQDVTIQVMASLAETRDNETGHHIRRTQHYVRVLAEELASHPRFRDELSTSVIDLMFKSAPLHDIGKVGIPDHILLKPGPLDADEWVIMKTHPTIGREAIERAERSLGLRVDFLRFAKEIAYGHHEKWDGSGYPQGLSGDAIPVSARLMALADVYDALISRRCYKAPIAHDESVAIVAKGRGTHFDPDVVDAFLHRQDAFQRIAATFADD
jgi:putative two-component system response regulator